MLAGLLTGEGYEVEIAHDGQQGLHRGLTTRFDLMLVDRGLPAIDGLGLLSRLRSNGNTTPTLILSALGNPRDRVEGLDAGAEDYLGKPFDIDELLARLRALLRRHTETAMTLQLPAGRFDTTARSVQLGGGTQVALSERECALLQVLVRRSTRIFSRAELMDRVFPDAEDEGVVDTYVHYLRRKLGRGVIQTVRGLGYRMGDG